MSARHVGDFVSAVLPEGTLTGVIGGFNGSGCSALVTVTTAAGPWKAGEQVPVPVRLLRAPFATTGATPEEWERALEYALARRDGDRETGEFEFEEEWDSQDSAAYAERCEGPL
jgi:hypothetical protein